MIFWCTCILNIDICVWMIIDEPLVNADGMGCGSIERNYLYSLNKTGNVLLLYLNMKTLLTLL